MKARTHWAANLHKEHSNSSERKEEKFGKSFRRESLAMAEYQFALIFCINHRAQNI